MDFKAMYDEKNAEKEAILKKLAPLREEENLILNHIRPLKAQLQAIRNKIAAIEKEDNLIEISKNIVGLTQILYKRAG